MPLHVTAYAKNSLSSSYLTHSSYPHVMNSIAGPDAPKYTFLIFYSSVVNGQMWCPVSLVECQRHPSTDKDTDADGCDELRRIVGMWMVLSRLLLTVIPNLVKLISHPLDLRDR
jgi:hypothetical protein